MKYRDQQLLEEAYKSMVKNVKDQYPDEPFKWASFVLLR